MNKTTNSNPELYLFLRQDWEISELGWGTRPDGYSLHKSRHCAIQYIEEYWDGMPDEVPSEYSSPVGLQYPSSVAKGVCEVVLASGNGARIY